MKTMNPKLAKICENHILLSGDYFTSSCEWVTPKVEFIRNIRHSLTEQPVPTIISIITIIDIIDVVKTFIIIMVECYYK